MFKEYLHPTKDELQQLLTIERDDKKKEEIKKLLDLIEKEPNNKQLAYKQELIVPAGHYTDVRVILSLLRNIEKQQPRKTTCIHNPITTKTHIKVEKQMKLHFNNSDIASCLGYSPNQTLEGFNISVSLATLKKYNSIYIYSNVVKNQNTGNTVAPLLRVVPVQTNHGECTCVHYDRPHFLPISSSIVDTIEVNIKDQFGEFISFEAGELIVTLVFRKRKIRF